MMWRQKMWRLLKKHARMCMEGWEGEYGNKSVEQIEQRLEIE
jgi:hypothetical protein